MFLHVLLQVSVFLSSLLCINSNHDFWSRDKRYCISATVCILCEKCNQNSWLS